MEPTNNLIQLENKEGKAIGNYLTTRTDTKVFQADFEAAMAEAQELVENDTEGWETRDYLDEVLAAKFDLWRVYADVAKLNLI